jgi:hypothetical protein
MSYNVQVAEARALQRTVRECYPLLLQSEGVDHSAVSVSYYLRHLLLLRTSSLLGKFQNLSSEVSFISVHQPYQFCRQ